MRFKTIGILSSMAVIGILTMLNPANTYAEDYVIDGAIIETTTTAKLKIDVPQTDIYEKADYESSVLKTAIDGDIYNVTKSDISGWTEIDCNGTKGYIRASGLATIYEVADEEVDEELIKRQEVVRYALKFLGNRYVYGGSDPNSGADCSGFTSYVMRNVIGVNLTHSSRAQAGEGEAISEDKLQPGDLIFYASGGSINHVAIYMGNGQIVHASSEKTGIKISDWDHRDPVKIVNIIG